MKTVVFDAGAAVWSLDPATFGRTQKPGTPGQHLRDYYDELRSTNSRCILPSPALSEALAFFYSPNDHDTALRLYHEGFEIPAFDARAASVAAKLWKDHDGKAIVKLLKEKFKISGQCVKIDFQIMATAMIEHATEVLSTDGDIKEICNIVGVKYLHPQDCKPSPKALPTGPNLFENISEEA